MLLSIDLEELGVMQLADSFFPSGLFATSNGIESIYLNKNITVKELTDIIKTFINQQVGPLDCVAAINTYNFADEKNFEEIVKVDQRTFSLKTIKETRDASIRSGIQLIRCVCEFVNDDMLKRYSNAIKDKTVHGVYPVSFALCCKALQIKKRQAALVMMYGFTTSVVGAALRLGAIQHFEGQKIIHQLKPEMSSAIKENFDASYLDMWQFTPQIDTFQMSHQKMDSKMFIT